MTTGNNTVQNIWKLQREILNICTTHTHTKLYLDVLTNLIVINISDYIHIPTIIKLNILNLCNQKQIFKKYIKYIRGFCIFTEESGSGCCLRITCVQICSMRIYRSKTIDCIIIITVLPSPLMNFKYNT